MKQRLMWRARPLLFLGWVTLATLPAATPQAAQPETSSPSPASRSPERAEDDAHYERLLRVYRGELKQEEILLITEVDPAPVLFLGPKVELRNLARLFASLPDKAHAQLRKTGFLKWKLDALPGDQRRWVSDMANRFTEAGDGPFKSAVTTGFIGIPSKGEDGATYSWWIDAEKALRPAWLPLVRARSFGGEAQFQAQLQALLAHRKSPASDPIPAREWLKVPDPQRLDVDTVAEEEAEAAFSKAYLQLLHAYQGKLKKDQLQKLTADDPLLARRLRTAEPFERSLNAFFARLSEADHQKLREEGRIQWTSGQLTAAQKRLLGAVVQEMNRRATEGGGDPPYSLDGPVGCMVGLTFVEVPMVKQPVLSWWIRSLTAPIPAWFSLHNDAAVKAPGYYEAHLAQLVR